MQSIQAIPSTQYEQTMHEIVRPYLAEHARAGETHGLYYEVYDQPKAEVTLVISHGFCETSVKYGEVIYELHRRGIRVVAFDHYGHGRSRRVPELGRLVHIDRFEEYPEGIGHIVDEVARPLAEKDGSRLCLLGHSMGGAAALIYLERNPTAFDRAVLNAPMVKMNVGGTGRYLASVCLSAAACLLGKAKDKPFVMSESDPAKERVEESGCDSATRFSEYQAQLLADPKLQHSASTYGWVYQASRATSLILQDKWIEKLTMPILMITAGKDVYVRNDAIDALCQKAPKTLRREVFPESRHEIYRGTDETISRWLTLVYGFLTEA